MTMINIRWAALGILSTLVVLGTSSIMDAALSLPLIAWTAWLTEMRPKDLDVIVLEGDTKLEEGEPEYLAYMLANDEDEEYERVRVLQVDTNKIREVINAAEDED